VTSPSLEDLRAAMRAAEDAKFAAFEALRVRERALAALFKACLSG
jgi:hypothetical protein